MRHEELILSVCGLTSGLYDRNLKLDGVRVYAYACSNELIRGGEDPKLDGIGTACHEFSHTLGLADLYNTNDGVQSVDIWDITAAGSYLGGKAGDGTAPMAYSAFERWQLSSTNPWRTSLSRATERFHSWLAQV